MKNFIVLVFILLAMASCKEQDKKKTENKTSTNESIEKSVTEKLSPEVLTQKISVIKDSVDGVWKTMAASEELMLQDIKRLLQEVSYAKQYNMLKQQKLLSLVDSVRNLRYTQDGMLSAQIDQYDAATDTLIVRTVRLVIETPEMESHPIANELIQDINAANGNIVYNRVKYDRWAKEFNFLIRTQKEALEQLGEPYSSYKEKPLFERPV